MGTAAAIAHGSVTATVLPVTAADLPKPLDKRSTHAADATASVHGAGATSVTSCEAAQAADVQAFGRVMRALLSFTPLSGCTATGAPLLTAAESGELDMAPFAPWALARFTAHCCSGVLQMDHVAALLRAVETEVACGVYTDLSGRDRVRVDVARQRCGALECMPCCSACTRFLFPPFIGTPGVRACRAGTEARFLRSSCATLHRSYAL